MATGPKLVHKQFNSPIGLYSQQNIQETLNKHLKNLDNGTVGIDFNEPGAEKPANLANSAVLRLLEEEENRGRKGAKKVVWPPVYETNGDESSQQQSPYGDAQHSPVTPQSQRSASPYQHPQYQQQQQQQQQQYQQQQYQQQQQQYQQQYQQRVQQQAQSAYCEGRRQEATGLSKLIPFGPGASVSARPVSPYKQGPPSPQPHRPPSQRWAPVSAPLSPQPQYTQGSHPYPEPEYQPPQRQWEPPPTTITLRQQPPIHQAPPPVFSSQPAAQSYQGGVNMRGDQKWPPQSVKEAVEAENEARKQLAKGPACRPRKVKKDYASFFAANALSHNFPAYRPPPGTQHYVEAHGQSSY